MKIILSIFIIVISLYILMLTIGLAEHTRTFDKIVAGLLQSRQDKESRMLWLYGPSKEDLEDEIMRRNDCGGRA